MIIDLAEYRKEREERKEELEGIFSAKLHELLRAIDQGDWLQQQRLKSELEDIESKIK